MHATMRHLPWTLRISLLFSSLKVGFWSTKVHTCASVRGRQLLAGRGGEEKEERERRRTSMTWL